MLNAQGRRCLQCAAAVDAVEAAAVSLKLCDVICHTVATISEQQLILRLPPSVFCHAILPCTTQDHANNVEIMQLSAQSCHDMFKAA